MSHFALRRHKEGTGRLLLLCQVCNQYAGVLRKSNLGILEHQIGKPLKPSRATTVPPGVIAIQSSEINFLTRSRQSVQGWGTIALTA